MPSSVVWMLWKNKSGNFTIFLKEYIPCIFSQILNKANIFEWFPTTESFFTASAKIVSLNRCSLTICISFGRFWHIYKSDFVNHKYIFSHSLFLNIRTYYVLRSLSSLWVKLLCRKCVINRILYWNNSMKPTNIKWFERQI